MLGGEGDAALLVQLGAFLLLMVVIDDDFVFGINLDRSVVILSNGGR
jgi:hypothetical protein